MDEATLAGIDTPNSRNHVKDAICEVWGIDPDNVPAHSRKTVDELTDVVDGMIHGATVAAEAVAAAANDEVRRLSAALADANKTIRALVAAAPSGEQRKEGQR